MKPCRSCGWMLHDNERLCVMCGSAQEGAAIVASPPRPAAPTAVQASSPARPAKPLAVARISPSEADPSSGVGADIVVGKSFAFIAAAAFKKPAMSWLRSFLSGPPRPRIVSLLGPGPVHLPGSVATPAELPPLELVAVTTDKALYREGHDEVNVLVVDPLRAEGTASLTIKLSGADLRKQSVELDRNGAGMVTLRDLPAGSYELYAEGIPSDAPATFTVAEYRLSPLVASLASRDLHREELSVELRVETYGVPCDGRVRLDLMDRDQRLQQVVAEARSGLVRAKLTLRGSGPHSINVQLEDDASRTATVPIVGSRASERSQTLFSRLGVEVSGALLPGDEADRPVRGVYLQEGATHTSPLALERVDAKTARLVARTAVDRAMVVVIDPSVPRRRTNAVDPAIATHPTHADPRYAHGERLFNEKKYEASLAVMEEALRRLEGPAHPYYSYCIACCFARLGQKTRALSALRRSLAEGWTDLDLLATDEDLEALHGMPAFESLTRGGLIEVQREKLAAGESIEIAIDGPFAVLAIGAYVNDKPWEGWAAVVRPTDSAPSISVAGAPAPGEHAEIVVTTASPASVYVIVKDARLQSPDTPESRLAAGIKSFVEGASKELCIGAPQKTLAELLAASPPRRRHGGPCPRCGAPNLPNAQHCAVCATEMDPPRGHYAPPPPVGYAPDVFGATSFPAPPGGFGAPQGGGFGPPGMGMAPPPAMMGPPPGMGMGPPPPMGMGPPPPMGMGPPGMGPPMARGAPMAPLPSPAAYAGAPPRMNAPPAPAPAEGSPYRAAAPVDTTPRAITAREPEVVFAGFPQSSGEGGGGSMRVPLAGDPADYIVEAFAVNGVDWAHAQHTFRADRDESATLELPAFVHTGDGAIGRLHLASRSGGSVRLLRDGAEVALTPQRAGVVAAGHSELSFVALPGDYELSFQPVGQLEQRASRRVDRPGKLRRLTRVVKLLQPGETIDKASDPSIVALKVLPSLDKPFKSALDATSDYGHACCEQTAAKILAACAMFVLADSAQRRAKAEAIIIAGVVRERSMWLRGRGFKMYPESSNQPDSYWGPKAAQYLWNLAMLRDLGGSHTPSASLRAAIEEALGMAADATTAHRVEWPPRPGGSCESIYLAMRFGQPDRARSLDEARRLVQMWSNQRWGAVARRTETAYAAALLFLGAQGTDRERALSLANLVLQALEPEGRLYSTVDSVALIALFSELTAARVVGDKGVVEIDGQPMSPTHAVERGDIGQVRGIEGVTAVEVASVVEENWDAFESQIDLAISLEDARGKVTRKARSGDSLTLVVKNESGYKAGDLCWVCLPDALSRVIGGGQVKRFSVDFEGRDVVRIPLAATSTTVRADGSPGAAHFGVLVRNMFEQERAGNPGVLEVTVA